MPIEDLIKLYGYGQSAAATDEKTDEEEHETVDNDKANISEQVRKYFAGDSDESEADDDYIPNESWKKVNKKNYTKNYIVFKD